MQIGTELTKKRTDRHTLAATCYKVVGRNRFCLVLCVNVAAFSAAMNVPFLSLRLLRTMLNKKFLFHLMKRGGDLGIGILFQESSVSYVFDPI